MIRLPHCARRARTTLFLLTLLAVVAGSASSASATFTPQGPKVKVMTRNMYFGADLTRAIVAGNIPDLLTANAQIFTNVQGSDIPNRAKSVAREIALERPNLVGLQEVSQWLSGPINDPAAATAVEYDQLDSLLYWLKRYGAPYNVVKSQTEIQIEAPAGAPYYKDFRLVDRDVILAPVYGYPKLTLSNAAAGNFATNLTIPAFFGPVLVTRGWVSVDASTGGQHFRFVNTHLESFHPGVRAAQAGELVAAAGPVGSAPGKAVLVGDINSDPNQAFPDNAAFGTLLLGGLTDTWAAINPGNPGLTCCFNELLNDPTPVGVFNQRIDHALTKGAIGVTHANLVGLSPYNRTSGGLWPSDHAGVVTTLTP
ncbi:MAG: endonuclease/exonuclease/phosphatase family protein [Thermoleophilaceae bacterium]|nr:endonuclease/exonuclease/phosphatase family protein [Thermoleophilaceae bacterium]